MVKPLVILLLVFVVSLSEARHYYFKPPNQVYDPTKFGQYSHGKQLIAKVHNVFGLGEEFEGIRKFLKARPDKKKEFRFQSLNRAWLKMEKNAFSDFVEHMMGLLVDDPLFGMDFIRENSAKHDHVPEASEFFNRLRFNYYFAF